MLSVMLRADNPESFGESVMPADHSMNARTFSMFSSSDDMAARSAATPFWLTDKIQDRNGRR